MAVTRRQVGEDAEFLYFEDRDDSLSPPYVGFAAEPKPGSPAAARAAIVDRLQQARQANQTYLDRANPTAAQTAAQVQLLTRQVNALIRVVFSQLDDATGT